MSKRNRRTGGGQRGRWDDADEQPWRGQGGRRDRPRRAGRRRQRDAGPSPPPAERSPPLIAVRDEPVAPACGRCREFVADDISGRGECLHPGSGVLRPWWDTPACPFFQP